MLFIKYNVLNIMLIEFIDLYVKFKCRNPCKTTINVLVMLFFIVPLRLLNASRINNRKALT